VLQASVLVLVVGPEVTVPVWVSTVVVVLVQVHVLAFLQDAKLRAANANENSVIFFIVFIFWFFTDLYLLFIGFYVLFI
jgi:hypothetical protein